MNRITSVVVSAAAVMTLIAPVAHAGPPAATSYEHNNQSVTIVDSSSNVLVSDGLGAYADREVIRGVTDQVDPAAQDTYWFSPWHRIFNLRVGTTTVECDSADSVRFLSGSNPDWFNDGGGVGQAWITCMTKGQSELWVVGYPKENTTTQATEECVVTEKTGDSTWTFSAAPYVAPSSVGVSLGLAPTGCPAIIWHFVKSNGQYMETERFENVSAPFELDVTLQS